MIFTSKNPKSASTSFTQLIFAFLEFRHLTILLISATFFLACENKIQSPIEQSVETMDELKSVTYEQMTAKMPVNYPEEILNFNYMDFKRIALNEQPAGNSNFRTLPGTSFDEIIASVRKKYPDFDNLKPEEYKAFFPELSIEEIIEKQEVIFQYVEKLMGYEVAMSVAALSRDNNKTSSLKILYDPNSCEEWYYASHLRLDRGGMNTAMDVAYAKAGYGTDDRSDANRHAVWNVYLGKYAAYRYGSVNEAMGVVLGLTEAHECDTPQNQTLNKDMDLFNNLVGLQYYVQIAIRYKKNIFDYNVKVTKSDDEIFNYINSLNSRLVSTSAEIYNGSPLNVLVTLK